jgi:hypothetical protein
MVNQQQTAGRAAMYLVPIHRCFSSWAQLEPIRLEENSPCDVQAVDGLVLFVMRPRRMVGSVECTTTDRPPGQPVCYQQTRPRFMARMSRFVR